MCRKFRELKAHEIDVRIGQCISTEKFEGVSLLLYKNARVDMDILDETVGAENWQRRHDTINENLYCSVGIWSEDKKEWVWKSDCGTESNTEKEKGEASDSFKRACVSWGIGRSLYSAPKGMLVACELNEKKKQPKDSKLRFFVSEIDYEEGKISKISIVNQKNEVVYSYPKKSNPTQGMTEKGKKTEQAYEIITKEKMREIYGILEPEKHIKFYENQLGIKYDKWGKDEHEAVIAVLENQKAKRAERKRETMRTISDEDIPFPMGEQE